MDKRERILDALQALLREGTAGTASVQDIATKAGIAKGGMYYYFKNKEEALDALAQRQYAHVIDTCQAALATSGEPALEKLSMLPSLYRSTAVDATVDRMLHEPQNAAIHQKSMAYIVCRLSPLLSAVFRQGIQEGVFQCDAPETLAELVLSMLVFLLDPGLFSWSGQAVLQKLEGLARLLEKALSAPAGSLSFFHENWTTQQLK